MRSFEEIAKNYKKSKYSIFSMPGHKNRAKFIVPKKAYGFDFTELSVTDDLYSSTGGIEQLEKDISNIFKSRFSCLSASGASLCVCAAMGIVKNFSSKILISRFCHSSAINGISIFGIKPIWLSQKRDGITFKPITAEQVEQKLNEDDEVKAVFITSPDYYGKKTDIQAISRVCKAHNALLVVDNSHGAHLVFNGEHPLKYADLVCDSFHKTLPCLTGTAALHIGNVEISKQYVKSLMQRLSSTSPSYLLVYSAAKCIDWMKKSGKKQYNNCYLNTRLLKNKIIKMGFDVNIDGCDDVRICISANKKGINGFELSEILEKNKIVCEMSDFNCAVLIATPFNVKKDFSRLLRTLKNIEPKPSIPYSEYEFHIPEKSFELCFAEGKKKEKISVLNAKGRVSAENKYIYPPSRPVVLTGEIIDDEIISELSGDIEVCL